MSTTTHLTPWHEVVRLREDLRSGELTLAVFAADIYEVVMDRGSKVYRNPYDFFALTYPTVNLRNLCRDVIWRLAGKSDKATRQLELTYGGGKTHTLITLYHLTHHLDKLPDLPAVKQFTRHIELDIPRTRVVVLPFDKLDVERGMDIKGPDGEQRRLKYPWSILAYQLAGDNGLRSLHAEGLAEERETPPAENLLKDLLEGPQQEGMATLLLIDEVLMYVREKVEQDEKWRIRLIDFFQYLTQAVTKVNTCAMVVSLLASDPLKSDKQGKGLTQELYAIFRRENEESIQPVEKEEVAEVLRRRFFTPESIANKEHFRSHVVAAYQGIANLDEQSARRRREVEDRLLESYPFHPDLTEVLYGKWTNIEGFQRTRGVLRTFAQALRDAEQWDDSPLISTNVFIGDPAKKGLSEATRELTSIVSHEEYEGKKYDWSNIVEGELGKARQIQTEHYGLKHREMEQAVFATFLHSQPLGADASLRDLYLLVGHTRPDKIELDKALREWVQNSWFLDERNIQSVLTGRDGEAHLPDKWRLGPRPNLTHMHHDAALHITRADVDEHLIEQIKTSKGLTEGAAIAGARVHKLPPGGTKDVEDNSEFHYVILGPKAASMVNDPSEEATRYINETSGPDKPRAAKNFILLVVPSKDSLDGARIEVQKYLGWLEVEKQLRVQDVDVARQALLKDYKNKSTQRVVELIRQMYNIVVSVDEVDGANKIIAFRLQGNGGPLFDAVKSAPQARIKLDPISAGALLPGGPYDLWKEGDKAHPFSHLVNAFAKYPRLPKLLKIDPIEQTIFQGCKEGIFVLRIAKSGTTFWHQDISSLDLSSGVLKDLEVVLPEHAELSEVQPELLQPGNLPALWENGRVSLKQLYEYFVGGYVASVPNEAYDYDDLYTIPQVSRAVINAAVKKAVARKKLWLIAGEASLYGEEVPEEILAADAVLQPPLAPISMHQILPEELPEAWHEEITTADVIAHALSQKQGQPLPWAIVSDVLNQAFLTRKLDRTNDSKWPCDIAGAKAVKVFQLSEKTSAPYEPVDQQPPKNVDQLTREESPQWQPASDKRSTQAILDLIGVQNLGTKVTELKTLTVGKELKINVRIEFSSKDMPEERLEKIKRILKEISPELALD